MALTQHIDQSAGSILTLTLGALPAEGGSRSRSIAVGGQKAMPFLFRDGAIAHPPVLALETWDTAPSDWPDELNGIYGKLYGDPVAWAVECVEKYGARLLNIRLSGAHPDNGNRSPDEEARFIAAVLKAVDVPLIIAGCGDKQKDNLVLPAVSEAARGERCLIGSALQDNYKTLTGAVLADGHSIIAESPIDINIAKQLNILISDMGLPLERIVMDPTIGALGYGMEYAYSIMERARLAALGGDKTLATPFICFVAQETWRAKEAFAPDNEFPGAGTAADRGVLWELITAAALIQSGADILVMRHPSALAKTQDYIDRLMKGA